MKNIYLALLFMLSAGISLQAQTCPCSLWSSTATPAVADVNETKPLEAGLQFTAGSNGLITGIRFYKGVNNVGVHTGSLWSSTGTLLARATFTGETVSGWQQVNFATPVAVTANTTYVASYFSPTGDFAVTRNFFTSTFSNPPLSAPAGIYIYSATSQFPTTPAFQSSNYWVDVVYSNPPPPPTSPVLTVIGATVSINAAVTPPVTTHTVALSWSASASAGVTGYNVYRSTVNGSSYVKINASPIAVTTFTDATAQGATTYFYVATAVAASGESVFSNQASAVIP
jgi:Domain of unknown function (DUF4082)